MSGPLPPEPTSQSNAGSATSNGPPAARCPRCGGAAASRGRRGETRNPFLARKKPDYLTCEDCGLDFDRPADSANERTRDSWRSPWSRP